MTRPSNHRPKQNHWFTACALHTTYQRQRLREMDQDMRMTIQGERHFNGHSVDQSTLFKGTQNPECDIVPYVIGYRDMNYNWSWSGQGRNDAASTQLLSVQSHKGPSRRDHYLQVCLCQHNPLNSTLLSIYYFNVCHECVTQMEEDDKNV
jgi:hypothetical protein